LLDHLALGRPDGRHCSGSMAKAILKPLVAWLELDTVPTLLFLELREQHAEQRRQIFLDAGGDDTLDRRPDRMSFSRCRTASA
jgi:hypothetical protein